ncbi:unnamed protein product [Prorocentrum cordatum]|uniref:Uncharacterized protein n=1 Tax=Prorocentrum cordatum TaxID=2364126 RepID=A0ABN9U0S1_9DINO|nr:unnamed protein product [Polarella glacialis]
MERGGRRREEEEEEEEEEEDLDVRAVRLPGRKRARGRAGRRRARGPLPASPPDWQRVCPPPGLGGAPMTGKAQKARRSLAAGLPSRLGGIQRGENTRGPDFAGTKKGEEEERREGFGVRVNVRVAHCTFDWHSCTASLAHRSEGVGRSMKQEGVEDVDWVRSASRGGRKRLSHSITEVGRRLK